MSYTHFDWHFEEWVYMITIKHTYRPQLMQYVQNALPHNIKLLTQNINSYLQTDVV